MSNLKGIELNVEEGAFEDVITLQKALSDALLQKGVKFSLSGIKLSKEALQTEVSEDNLGGIIEMALSVATDKSVRKALFTLGAECTVVKDSVTQKVNPEFFEARENRKHYFPVMIEIIKVNLLPFFEGLNLGSLVPGALNAKDPK